MNYNRQHYRLEFTKSRHRVAREEWTSTSTLDFKINEKCH